MKLRNLFVVAVFLVAVLVVLAGLAYVWLSLNRPGGNEDNQAIVLAPVQTGLAWPIALAFASDQSVFYAERYTGNIQVLGSGTSPGGIFFTIPEIASSGEQGLLGLAVDPEFGTRPYVYAYYTRDDNANNSVYNRIVRVRAMGSIETTMEVLLDRIPAGTFHNGGVIAFGPDGMLYAVIGEATNSGSAQDLMSVTGKVLRLNPDGSAPADNPFAAMANANPLIFTYGHRNMFGIAWHPTSQRAYVTENGPGDSDEINLLIAGRNYGWPNVRGIANTPPFTDPLVAYTPAIVPTNAAFYTATVPAQSRNHLIFGSFNGRTLRELTLDPGNGASVVKESLLAAAPEGIVDVEMAPDGHLWVTTPSAIYRIVPAPTPVAGRAALIAFPGGLSIVVVAIDTRETRFGKE